MNEPLVSCLVSTFGRPHLLKLAVQSFRNQDWPNKELVILADSKDHNIDLSLNGKDVRIVVFPGKRLSGEKRNLGVTCSRGEYIVHWDDDDWFGPERIRKQVEPLVRGEADLTALPTVYMFQIPGGLFLKRNDRPGSPPEAAFNDCSIAYTKKTWSDNCGFDNIAKVENHNFLARLPKNGKKVLILKNEGDFVYVRHPQAWLGADYMIDLFDPVERPDFFPKHIWEQYVEAGIKQSQMNGNGQT